MELRYHFLLILGLVSHYYMKISGRNLTLNKTKLSLGLNSSWLVLMDLHSMYLGVQ